MKDDFYPCVLRTDPPTVMTREQAYSTVPNLRVTHIPATNPRPEHTSTDDLPIPDNHRRTGRL